MISLLVKLVDLLISFSLVGIMLTAVVILPYLLLTSIPVYAMIILVVVVGFTIHKLK